MMEPATRGRRFDWATLSMVVLAVTAATYGLSLTVADPDLWGHIRFGRDILDRGQIVNVDPYSYLTGDRPWINHEWLAEVLFAGAFAAGGSGALIALKTGLGLLMLGLVCWRLMRQGLAPIRAGLCALFSYLLMSKGLAVLRPQIFTFLLFAVLLVLLDEADRGRLSTLWAVPAVFGLWANLHGGLLAGLGILLIWMFTRVALALYTGRFGRAEVAFVASGMAALAAILLNPYGARLLAFLARPATVVRPEISEWQPIVIASIYGLTYLVFIAVWVAALVHTTRRRRPATVVVFACLALAPLLAIRHGALLAVGAPLLLAEHLGDAWNRWSPSAETKRRPLVLAVLAFVVAGALLWAALPRFRCIRLDPTLAIAYPARATATLRATGAEGNLAIPFDWGEYAIWHLGPRLKVSQDGRRETVYSDAVLLENLQFMAGVRHWDALLDMRTDLALVDRSQAAFNLLKLYPGWVSVYEDRVAAIFAKENSPLALRIRDASPSALPADGTGLCFP